MSSEVSHTELAALMPRFTADGQWAEAAPQVPQSYITPERVCANIARLPDPYRSVLVCHDCQGLSAERISTLIHAPVREIRRLVHQARLALVQLLAEAA